MHWVRLAEVGGSVAPPQIAGQLYISISKVLTHLGRIRDKTSCHRRADLTRLGLRAGLV